MKIVHEGHKYKLNSLDGEAKVELTFVRRFRGEDNYSGTTNQEVLRVLIDRVEFLDKEMPWDGNKEILKHLRMALVLHESRALVRKVEKDEIKPELVKCTDKDGHFKIELEN